MISELSSVLCVICDARIDFEYEVELNELIECLDCGTELEVSNINPITIIEVDVDCEDWGE